MGRLIDPFAGNNELRKWVYVSPDGAMHPFYDTLHADVLEADNDNVFYTRDGTYHRLRQSSATSCLIESPDGIVRTFELSNGEWRLARMADSFTNYLAISYATPGLWTLTDNHGRTQTVYFKVDPTGSYPSVVDRVVVSSFAGGTATYTFAYTTGTVSRSETDNDPATSATLNLPLLASVTAPDGSKHSFGYQASGAAADSSGRLASMQLPTLGRIEWTYQKYSFTSAACASTLAAIYRANTGIASREMVDNGGTSIGVWSLRPAVKGATSPAACGTEGEMTNTVITPVGDKTVSYFSVNVTGTSSSGWNRSDYALPSTRDQVDSASGAYLSRQLYDCDTAGNNCQLLQSHYVRYAQDGPSDPATSEVANTNRRETSQRTLYHNDVENGVTRFSGVDRSEFDGLGHFRKEVTNGNFGNGDVREQAIDYNASTGTYPSAAFTMPATNAPWIIHTYNKRKTVEGTSSQVVETCFDRKTGFLNRQRNWSSMSPTGTASSNDVFIVYTPDAAGQVAMEQYYGGNVQWIATSSPCALAVPSADQYQIRHTYQYGTLNSSQYYTNWGPSFGPKFVDRDIDRNTGLVKTSRDSAGLATVQEYDSMGRLTWVKPQAGHGAWTQYYRTLAAGTDYAKTFIYKKGNGTGALLTYKADVQDPFGRVWWEQTCIPGGTCPSRYTHRNAMGWVTYKSEYSNDAPKYTVSYDHDPFGRPRVARPPDGAHHDTSYQYAGLRSVKTTVATAISYTKSTGQINEAPRSTTKIYDRQGRMWKEVNHTVDSYGSPRDIVTTNYYNVAGQILETKKDGVRVGPLYSYDGRGFLSSQYSEDLAAETTTFMDIDALGNSRRSQRLNHTLSTVVNLATSYDRAGRLVKVSDPNDASKVWKEFVYADANGTNDWRGGKLWKAIRYNDMSQFFPNVGVVVVTESYTYGGAGGRISKLDTEMSDRVGRSEKTSQTYAYTELGEPRENGYPSSVAGSNFNIGRQRKVTNTYSNGFLTSITGTLDAQPENWVSSISYHPHGLVSQVVHTNGVTDHIAKDGNGFKRVASVTTSGARNSYTNGPDNLNTGDFQYDGGGKMARVGTEFFVPEQGYVPPPPTSQPPIYYTPCDSGWIDPLGFVYAMGDRECNPKVFYFYTASDRLYKLEDGDKGERNWYFYDQSGRLLTEYSTAYSVNQLWPGSWLYTRDLIYRDSMVLAIYEKRFDTGQTKTLRNHPGYGAKGIQTDAGGYKQ